MKREIALIGNPNCGKTTLFNSLTGTYQKTGNWTGVTVDKKHGEYKKDSDIKIVDLPGLYSLTAKSNDERIVIDYVKNSKPTAIINVVDGTNLERNLFLSLELSSLNIPTVIAVNMIDRLDKNKIKFNIDALKHFLGVPVVAISALKGDNLGDLIKIALENKKTVKRHDLSLYKGESDTERRYKLIESQINGIIERKITREQKFTEKIDNVLMNGVWGFIVFFCVLTLIYLISIKLGGLLGGVVGGLFESAENHVKVYLNFYGVPELLISMLCDAVISGIGAVLSLLPQILILFFLLSLLDESGYSSRIAFLLDRIFSVFGLSGKSLVPMIVSCGCTVAGLSATRSIEDDGQRRLSVFLTPFMPCGAKMAVFGFLSFALFGGSAIVATSMYFLSILCVCIFGFLLKRFKVFSSSEGGFILEIPTLKIPSAKNVLSVLIEKLKEFIFKVGTTIFLLSVSLWALKSFGFSGFVGNNADQSFLFDIGNLVKYIFYPLGFGNWQASVSIVSGIFAKEGIVETLNIVCTDTASLFYNGFSAYAFMCFILLSPPCIASIATAKRELASKKLLTIMLIFQFLSAYALSFIINLTGFLIESATGLILSLIIVIISIVIIAVIIKTRKSACANCAYCIKGENKCQKAKRYTT